MSVRRDYKPESSWRSGRRRIRLHGLLVLTLVTIGLFSSLLAYIRGKVATDAAAPIPAVASRHQPAAATPPAAAPVVPVTAPPAAPKYDFYKVLPERKLVITGAESQQRKAGQTALPPVDLIGRAQGADSPGGAGQARAAKTYLQAGSFSSPTAANQRKASLTAMGIPARVDTTTDADGAKVHRVRIGPIRDANQLKTLRQRLRDRNIPVSTQPVE